MDREAGSPLGRSLLLNAGRVIGVRAVVPLPLPLHGREFHGRARRERVSAWPEPPACVDFQCFV
jgi:hypothetical protein